MELASIVADLQTLLVDWIEVLKSQIAGENDVTQQEKLHCEIRELGELIPDLESKVMTDWNLKALGGCSELPVVWTWPGGLQVMRNFWGSKKID